MFDEEDIVDFPIEEDHDSYEYLKREAITADRFDYEVEEEEQEDYWH